jgi:hypothetical protein
VNAEARRPERSLAGPGGCNFATFGGKDLVRRALALVVEPPSKVDYVAATAIAARTSGDCIAFTNSLSTILA